MAVMEFVQVLLHRDAVHVAVAGRFGGADSWRITFSQRAEIDLFVHREPVLSREQGIGGEECLGPSHGSQIAVAEFGRLGVRGRAGPESGEPGDRVVQFDVGARGMCHEIFGRTRHRYRRPYPADPFA